MQRRLAARVVQQWDGRTLRWIAGLDAAFSGARCVAGVVLWDLEHRTVLERHTACRTLWFPYIPGLLSFREAPALLAALRKLQHAPHLLMCDGQGMAHPRRFGIACHVGTIVGLPAIGCAKSRLTGEAVMPGSNRGDTAPLVDRGEVVGTIVRTRTNTRPVYVSIGHLIDLQTAVEVVLSATGGHRLPEPTRLADRLVAEAKRTQTNLGSSPHISQRDWSAEQMSRKGSDVRACPDARAP